MDSPAPWWIALALTGVIAATALRAGSLRTRGALTATVTGVLALRVQWAWGLYLIGWFVAASLLSRLGRTRKSQRTHDIVAKGDQRDAWQVMANGGVFALCAAWWLLDASLDEPARVTLAVAAAAALAAAGSDTWSTEIGTLYGRQPLSLRTLRRAHPGESGAVTLIGSLGGTAGALLLTWLAVAVGMTPSALALPVTLGALAGAWSDTLLGAWAQERRWCSACHASTERAMHSCGTPTQHRGGIRGLSNDVVNALCTFVGAVVAVMLTRLGIGLP